MKVIGQGQGHRSKKGENAYSRNVKLRWAIAPALQNLEPRRLRATWVFKYGGSNGVAAIIVT